MADRTLVSYLREHLQSGYDINTLRNHLLNQGYDINAVNAAVDEIYSPTVKHEVHLSKGLFIAVGSVFAAVILIIGIFFLYSGGPKQLLDLSVDIVEASVKPGEELEFGIEISSLGSAKRYDVFLRYDIVMNKRIITSKEETIAVETKASKSNSIKIPDDASVGKYTLKVTAKYNNEIATASESFRVYEESVEESCFDGIKNQDEEKVDCGGSCNPCVEEKKCPSSCDDSDECTKDYCSSETWFECVNDAIDPCCGNNICEEGEKESCKADCPDVTVDEFSGLTIWEKLEKIKEISATDPEKAGEYCNEIENIVHKDKCFLNIAETTKSEAACDFISDTRTKDDCYSVVAIASNNYELCTKVNAESRRDSCYMDFVMDGNYDICDRLINQYLMQSCNALKGIEDVG